MTVNILMLREFVMSGLDPGIQVREPVSGDTGVNWRPADLA
jgi:hypothetical protein